MCSILTPADYRRRATGAGMERTAASTSICAAAGSPTSEMLGKRLSWRICPDLIVLLPSQAAIVELKSQKRQMTRGQVQVRELLAGPIAFFGGVVGPEPRAGEQGYDEFLEWLKGSGL